MNNLPHFFQFPDKNNTLDISDGIKWRELRKVLSPTFTSGRLKGMLQPMNGVADNLLEFVEKQRAKNDSVVNLRRCFEGLALDTISRDVSVKKGSRRAPF